MGYSCERFAIFASLLSFVLCLSLVVTAISTDYWFESPVSTDRVINTKNTVHAGLFRGERIIDWGLGPRVQIFTIYEEVHNNIGFMNKIMWIFCLFFVALGILWALVGILTSLLSAVMTKQHTVAGPIGIYLWSLLALVSFSASCIIFYIQFSSTIRHNVLLAGHIEAGFSTEGQARLGYSFFLMLCALVVLYFPPILVFFSTDRRRKLDNVKEEPNTFDPNILMY